MSGVDLNSVINLIMQNPELLSEIKRLAEENAKDTDSSDSTEAEVKEVATAKEESAAAMPATEPQRTSHSGVRRSELLHALSPYMSPGRQKAIETFMTIADILDMMRTK